MSFGHILRRLSFTAVGLAVFVSPSGVATAQQDDVNTFDAALASSEQNGFSAKNPQIVVVSNGVSDKTAFKIAVGWREYSGGNARKSRLAVYSYQDTSSLAKSWEVTLPLSVLGGVTTDGTNLYALCARAEDLRDNTTTLGYRTNVLQMVKYDWTGKLIWTQDLNNKSYLGALDDKGNAPYGIYSPFTAGTGQLQYGNGQVLVAMSNNTLPDENGVRHQKAVFFSVAADGSGSGACSESSFRHSFDQRVMFDGTDFVISELADASWYMPAAGISIRKGKPGDKGVTFTPTSFPLGSTGVYIYARRGNNDPYGNFSFTSLGDIAPGENGYVALFASQKSNGDPPNSGFTSPVPEPRNLAMVHVVKGFDAVADGNVTTGENYSIKSINIKKTIVDSDGETLELTRADKPEQTFQQTGVVWLTNHTTGVSVERPRLVRVKEGRYIALWEEWTYEGTGQNLTYQATKAMVLNEKGEVIVEAKSIDARLNPSGADRPFAETFTAADFNLSIGGVFWVVGAKGGKFRMNIVDENLNLTFGEF